MNKRLLIFTLCLLLAVFPAAAPAQDAIDEQADLLFRQSQTIGGALAVVLDGQIVYQRCYGYQDRADQVPVTADTYFRIASVTKMVSAIGLMQLVEQGLLDLDADISEYFGFAIANDYHPDTPVTLRQLMSHTAALSTYADYETSLSLETVLSQSSSNREYITDHVPGSFYEYSNFGAGLTGAIMEAVTGVSVNQYMRENVFGPLSIDASYDPAALADPDSIATLYHSNGTRYHSVEYLLSQPYEDFADPAHHFSTTVGSLWIRAADLATLTVALCGGGAVNGAQLLSSDSLFAMRRDQADTHASVTGESPYGLFLAREETLLEGHTFYGHQGVYRGILCNVYFEPETQFGFVLLTNGCSTKLRDHVGILSRRLFALAYETFVTDEDYQPFLVR